ncbi:hypothetical protein CR532_03515 [Candidatus Borreliella tachyglossi]|uniref:Uncharacterized protein n=1 Tax=Candidatus Borreliella tachyglossi TaxID=1964448 RepID=A0A2S1LXK1_9SPIR|nr:hypothetical protein [Candidatus Borreliella tachyglossi]AWG43024.1 hypothetical protein CR532_03515 [Candidatus Borreliella tachyglossi]
MIKIIFLILFFNIALHSRLITTSIETRTSEEIKKYSAFNLILEEEYYTKHPKIQNEIDIYELTEKFTKSIIKGKIDYTAMSPTYSEVNKYLLKGEIIDKSFLQYKIFKIKAMDKIFKSLALLYTKKGFYKLELYIGNNKKNKLEIFNLNISYFKKNPNEIKNEMIFYKTN